MFTLEADESSEGYPVECPVSSFLVPKYSNHPRWYTDTEFIDTHPTPSSEEEMSEFMDENHEEKNTQCENNAD